MTQKQWTAFMERNLSTFRGRTPLHDSAKLPVENVSFPRTARGNLEARVTGYESIPELRDGVLIVEDESAGQLDAAMLSRENNTLVVTLPVAHAIPPS